MLKTFKYINPSFQVIIWFQVTTDNNNILEHQNNKQKLHILEALHIRNLQPTLNRINFLKQTIAAIMMLYRNTKVKVCSPDGDKD